MMGLDHPDHQRSDTQHLEGSTVNTQQDQPTNQRQDAPRYRAAHSTVGASPALCPGRGCQRGAQRPYQHCGNTI
eukprot:1420337-Amphidinium_carterae.1